MKKQKTTQKDYDELQANLARISAFDHWNKPPNDSKCATVDKDYVFQPTTTGFKIGKFFTKGALRTMLPLANKLLFDLKIEGKDNLKCVDNAVRVSNHVLMLDTMINFQVAFGHRHFMTGAYFNIPRGFAGKLFRCGGFLPLSNSIKAMSNLDKEITNIFSKGNSLVTFYAEQAEWERYENSRPLKKGAFHYAVKNNVPVIMTVILFREPTWIRKKLGVKKDVTVKILPAIYPKQELSDKENIEYLQKATQEVYDRTICDFYGYDYNLYDMRLTALENKLVAKGLIDKEEALAQKPNDDELRRKILVQITKKQIQAMQADSMLDLSDEDIAELYESDLFDEDKMTKHPI